MSTRLTAHLSSGTRTETRRDETLIYQHRSINSKDEERSDDLSIFVQNVPVDEKHLSRMFHSSQNWQSSYDFMLPDHASAEFDGSSSLSLQPSGDESPESASTTVACEPSEYDVLLGKGQANMSRTGNKRFNSFINLHKDRYNNELTPRSDKIEITQRIVDCIRETPDGSPGRFLKYDTSHGHWLEVTEERARRKVSQTFRNVKRAEAEGVVSRTPTTPSNSAIIRSVSAASHQPLPGVQPPPSSYTVRASSAPATFEAGYEGYVIRSGEQSLRAAGEIIDHEAAQAANELSDDDAMSVLQQWQQQP